MRRQPRPGRNHCPAHAQKTLPGLGCSGRNWTRDLSVLFAEVVTQLGIEPMTTRCFVVALTTKLLGRCGRSLPPICNQKRIPHAPRTCGAKGRHPQQNQSGNFIGFIPPGVEWKMNLFFDAGGLISRVSAGGNVGVLCVCFWCFVQPRKRNGYFAITFPLEQFM